MKKLLLSACVIFGIGLSAQTYCTPTSVSGCDVGDNINSFTIPAANFSHLDSGCSTGAYGDFTSQTINLNAGLNYSYTVTHGYSSQKVRIWIDLNNDGAFTDSAPELISSASSVTVAGLYTTDGILQIPATTAPGSYRMRVGDRYSLDPVPCDNDGYGEFHDYTVNLGAAPSCLPPNAPLISAVAPDAAVITWAASPSTVNLGYDYYISTSSTQPTAATVPTGTVAASALTANPQSLSPNTQYYVWVRSKCSAADTSVWSVSSTFTTLCSAFTIPYSENFDTTSVGSYIASNAPQCWSYLETNGSNGVGFVVDYDYNSSSNAYFLSNEDDTSGDVMLVSPKTTSLADGTRRVRFFAKGYAAGYSLEVGTMTDVADPATFSSITTIALTDSHAQYIVNIPAGTNSFLVFKHGLSNTYESIYLDDITIENIPSCLEPFLPVVTAFTTTTATLTWTAPPTVPAAGYQVYYSTSNTAPTASTVLNASNSASFTTASGQISGLNPGTTYYFWVRSTCTTSNASPWSTSTNFTTLCVPTVLPYSLDFENLTVPALPNCGTAVNEGSGNIWKTADNPSDATGFTGHVLKYNFNSANAANTWFFTQGITLTAGTQYTISYKYANNSTASYTENLKVSYGTSATAAGMTTVLADYPGISSTTATTASVNFTPTAGGVYYFGFNAYSDADQYYLYVDDITVTNAVLATSETVKTKNNLTVYPNPFSDVLNISDIKNVKSISVVDVAGRVVKSFDKPSATLQLSDLSAGMYMVILNMNDGTKQTIKTIKK